MDVGTENINCQDLLVYFTDEQESFLYASSTRIQRTEALWLRLKKHKLSWYIDFFLLLLNQIFKKLYAKFAFLPPLRKELNEYLTTPKSNNYR